MRHIVSALVENKPGVLARISTLFAARGYNIDSLTVAPTEDPTISRMTIVVEGDERILEQVEKQLNKLIDVIKVREYSEVEHLERDLMLVKVKADKSGRSQIIELVDIFRAKIVDVSQESLIIEVTGDKKKVDALLELLRPYGVIEMVRTGVVAMARGK
jgi:acetolactate synthase-1/3 small subunit